MSEMCSSERCPVQKNVIELWRTSDSRLGNMSKMEGGEGGAGWEPGQKSWAGCAGMRYSRC